MGQELDQTVTLTPDPKQWTWPGAAGSPRSIKHGCDDLETVLKDVNVDIMFVLFPLNVVPVKLCRNRTSCARQDYPEEPSYEVWQNICQRALL